MTPAEILALIEENEEEEAELRVDLKEAYAKIAIESYFAAIAAIKASFDADDIDAVKAEYDIRTLKI